MQLSGTAHQDGFDTFLTWLVDLADFDPQQGSPFFDAPGTASLNQGSEVVELPWALSHYRQEQQVLDIGAVYQYTWYRDALYHLGAHHLMGIDPRESGQDWSWLQQGGAIPLATEAFSLITCLSKLTLLGRFQGEIWALGELYRLLMPGGRLLLSLPLGAGFYSQRQWMYLLTSYPMEIRTLRYFCYSEGWLECYPDLACRGSLGDFPQGLGCVELVKS